MSEGNITELNFKEKRPREVVWSCFECNAQLHYIHQDGRVECGDCGYVFQQLRAFDPTTEGKK